MYPTSVTRREALQTLSLLAGAVSLPGAAFAARQKTAAAPPAAPPVKIAPLAKNVSLVTGQGGNIALVTGEDGPLIVDTGVPTQAKDLMKALQDANHAPVGVVINTHWHFDHTGGNLPLGKSGARIIAQENVRKRLATDQVVEFLNIKSPATPRQGLPIVTFDDTLTLYVNGQTIHLTHVDPAHTDSDIIAHFADVNVLHAGDLLFNGFYPFIDYSSKGWIGGMVAGADKILAMADATTKIIPGHGPMATKADVEAYRNMLVGVQEKIEPMLAAGKSVDEVIAAKPTAAYDDKWGKGFLTPDKFVQCVYVGLTRHKA